MKEWLNIAIGLEGIEEVLEKYDGMMSEIELNYHQSGNDTEEQIKKRLEIEDCIMVYCDKNLGMSLFTLEMMREADKNLMNQFGAKLVNKTEADIFEEVLADVDEFEGALDEEQKEYIDYAYSNRNLRGVKVKMPFLRSTHKVQKMSLEEIENKNTSSLKFRPVIDAKSWITRGYATLVMGMIRKANEELVSLAGSVLKKSKIKNGWRFSKEMSDFKTNKTYCVLVSADIQEAYTNIQEDMINRSIEQVCKFIEWPEWKINLMTSLITLVLKNNFVKTSTGIYLFKRVLPMGYKLSGECLDIVGLSGELSRMFRLGDDDLKMKGLPIGELMEYPDEFVDASVEREISMVNGILSYMRYVDDTHIIIGGDDINEVIDGLFAVGYMFPSGLVINVDCNIWRSEFLDVLTWRNLEEVRMSTMVKKNFKVPFGHVKKHSDHPKTYKMQSMLGELLRCRRICSDDEVIKNVDDCIKKEFESIGYCKLEVIETYKKAIERIETGYSRMYVKIPEELEDKKIRYGGSIVFNSNYNYDEILTRFIRSCGPAVKSRIVKVPGNKVKSIAYSKNNYIRRQKDDVKNKLKEK